VESNEQAVTWRLECELKALSGALRQFSPSVRAARFHKRQAWFLYAEGLLKIEIDRGAAQIVASGNWPATLVIRCGHLYMLSKSLPLKQGTVVLSFINTKFCVSGPGFKWNCPASIGSPPESFTSTVDSTRLWPHKKNPDS
jgi:hypothetical protein